MEETAALTEASYRLLRFEGTPRLRRAPVAKPRLEIPVRSDSTLRADPEMALARAILARADLDPQRYRASSLRRRIPALLRALRASGPIEGVKQLVRDAKLTDRALNSLLIGHTEAFRDPDVFRCFRDSVLPRIANRRPLRIWSVGCSTGEELLSVAALLADEPSADQFVLRGSDCRPAAIKGAESSAESFWENLRTTPWRLRCSKRRYLDVAEGIQWRVEDVFSPSDRDSPWDVILCRNLSIYLQPDAAATLWKALVRRLSPGGVLLTGRAERPMDMRNLRRIAKSVYELEPDSQ